MRQHWQLEQSLDTIIFDCDGTLADIEGIDELARANGCYQKVSKITTHCMSVTGLNVESYGQRLQMIKPTHAQLTAVANQYIDHITPYAKQVINIFQSLGKHIYIVSSGFTDAIIPFAYYLGIEASNIRAVSIYFDKTGRYADFDRESPLVHAGGKSKVINQLLRQHKNAAFIGDGMSDYEASDSVQRFIGYGGMCVREKVAALSEFYLLCHDMQPLLPLCLTRHEYAELSHSFKQIYDNGVRFIESGKVMIQKDKKCLPSKY